MPTLHSGGAFSDSEAELDNEEAQVVLPQKVHGVGNVKSQVRPWPILARYSLESGADSAMAKCAHFF
jgi:hypothetical protein